MLTYFVLSASKILYKTTDITRIRYCYLRMKWNIIVSAAKWYYRDDSQPNTVNKLIRFNKIQYYWKRIWQMFLNTGCVFVVLPQNTGHVQGTSPKHQSQGRTHVVEQTNSWPYSAWTASFIASWFANSYLKVALWSRMLP